MESIFKATVMFLLTFSVPTETNNENKLQEMWCCAATETTPAPPQEENDGFWLAGFLMMAE